MHAESSYRRNVTSFGALIIDHKICIISRRDEIKECVQFSVSLAFSPCVSLFSFLLAPLISSEEEELMTRSLCVKVCSAANAGPYKSSPSEESFNFQFPNARNRILGVRWDVPFAGARGTHNLFYRSVREFVLRIQRAV